MNLMVPLVAKKYSRAAFERKMFLEQLVLAKYHLGAGSNDCINIYENNKEAIRDMNMTTIIQGNI